MLTATLTTFVLIFLAEIGDKSQLVCMLLASRHRPRPVFAGALVAFALLNLVAVWVGSTLAHTLPLTPLKIAVGLLFIGFGVHALWPAQENDDESVEEKPGHGIFITAFLMIFVAELGDKTQLAVAGLSTSSDPIAVYTGATLALAVTSLLGVLGGKWITRIIHPNALHRLAGVLFIAVGGWLLWGLYSL
jgi:Ca2+/H+ antiporter, TMEM165/GDT1 family